jgi:hypothetical protein
VLPYSSIKRRTRKAKSSLAVKVYPCGREVCQNNAAGKAEYLDRLVTMVRRQFYQCPFCKQEFGGFRHPTFDHQDGRGMGGAHRDDRIEVNGQPLNAALCSVCNGLKGSRRYFWKEGSYVPR